MDVLFLDVLEFRVPARTAALNLAQALSREEGLRECMAAVGLELIDYGSFHSQALASGHVRFEVFSLAHRERAQRAALSF